MVLLSPGLARRVNGFVYRIQSPKPRSSDIGRKKETISGLRLTPAVNIESNGE